MAQLDIDSLFTNISVDETIGIYIDSFDNDNRFPLKFLRKSFM